MKIFLLTTLLITQLVGHCMAGTSVLREIPVSKLGISQALTIFERQMTLDSTNHFVYSVVSIDWCKASEFQPRIGDWRWIPGHDDPNEYSWFVTYIYKDEQREKDLKERGIKRRFNEVGVTRIKDDGKIGFFIGAR